MNMEQSKITRQQLLDNGWTELNEEIPIYLFEKQLGESQLKMVVHALYNSPVFALVLPDGGMLNIDVGTIEDLSTFTSAITSYDPNY